jgi:aspartyl-tRNA(Asn)/glutamyl-tRNA(Gln) amidotransferase subunit A
MSSLKIIHEQAIEDKDFLDKKYEDMIIKIKNDKTGSCWHQEEVAKYSLDELKRLKSLSLDEKRNLPFYGLTIGVKDLFCVKGLTTSAGSKILEKFKSPYDSEVWRVLKDKGVLIGGKLSMDEFAMGSFTNTSHLGKTSIPQYPERTAGGSSGGSGASLAGDLFDFTIGSDTGGSVRLPASFCSVYGYKPSYGSFSRYGMIPYASSLDQAGFLTKSLDDLEYILKSEISFKDKKDTTQVGLGKYNVEIKNKFKVAYFPEILEQEGVQEVVKKAYAEQIKILKLKGCELVEIDLKLMHIAAQIYYVIACSEASSNLAKYQGIYTGHQLIEEKFEGSFWERTAQFRSKYFGLEVQKRIMLGSYMLSSENFGVIYEKSWNLRRKLKEELIKILEKADTIVLPVSPMVAPKWEDIDKMSNAEIYMSDFMTVPFSLAGLPAISVPDFKTEEGLGIGMQWVGNIFKDYQLVEDIKKIKSL